jgi:hypothetical protein
MIGGDLRIFMVTLPRESKAQKTELLNYSATRLDSKSHCPVHKLVFTNFYWFQFSSSQKISSPLDDSPSKDLFERLQSAAQNTRRLCASLKRAPSTQSKKL